MPETREEFTEREDLEQAIRKMNGEALLAGSYEDSLIGFVELPGQPAVALYDRTHCIRTLRDRDDMSADGAKDYFEHNTMGSERINAPGFATILRPARGTRLNDKAVEDFIRKLREQAIKDPESGTAVIQLLVTAIGDDKDEPLDEIARTVLEILEPDRLGGLKWLLCTDCGVRLRSEGEQTQGLCDGCHVKQESNKPHTEDA